MALGPGRAFCVQEIKIRPNSRYRLSAWVKTELGADTIELIASDFGGPKISVASALTEYNQLSLEFTSARIIDTLSVTLCNPAGAGAGYVDDLALEYLGEAPEPVIQEFVKCEIPPQVSEGGVETLPHSAMEWFLDAKFGMFIHWGIYSSVDKGSEWVMHSKRYSPEDYRARGENPETGFTAAKFDPVAWAELAKKSGMKYSVLTTRHHDGYALFESKHPNSWTSVKHLGRDLVKEYTDAVRKSGLHVGLYYSPMSWRYPGYYNVTGDNMKPNVWGYTAEPWHKENARLMKEEVYEQLGQLLAHYGPIEYMFWDGGWLGQSVDNELEARFWDAGKYQDPKGDWLVGKAFQEKEGLFFGKALGVMGMVRKHQPRMIVNERFGWVGDVHGEEGGAATSGDIRTKRYMEKCMSVQRGGWGYVPHAPVVSFEEVAVFLSDCVVRNMNLLLNVAPDREGVIPMNQQEVLLQTGDWLQKVGSAIYNTRGGPWQPLHGEYGFTYSGKNIYCHIYAGYRHKDQGTFTTQSIGSRKVGNVIDLYSGQALPWTENNDHTITIEKVNYNQTPYVTILQITLNEDVYKN
ncbi:MAG: alpha-L-fucosidase [Candidatus Methylacidiphilales bacterium]|nr:alpha-L-fucosidase [Candidatus Methylacidiphilales bacterium]